MAVAVVEAAVRRLGVTAYARASRGGEVSRLRCVFGYLLVAGTHKDGPLRARHFSARVPKA